MTDFVLDTFAGMAAGAALGEGTGRGFTGTVYTSHVGTLGASWSDCSGSSTAPGATDLADGAGHLNVTGPVVYASGVPPTADYAVELDFVYSASVPYTAVVGRYLVHTAYTVPAGGYIARLQYGGTFDLAVNPTTNTSDFVDNTTVAATVTTTPTGLVANTTYTLRLEMVGTSITARLLTLARAQLASLVTTSAVTAAAGKVAIGAGLVSRIYGTSVTAFTPSSTPTPAFWTRFANSYEIP